LPILHNATSTLSKPMTSPQFLETVGFEPTSRILNHSFIEFLLFSLMIFYFPSPMQSLPISNTVVSGVVSVYGFLTVFLTHTSVPVIPVIDKYFLLSKRYSHSSPVFVLRISWFVVSVVSHLVFPMRSVICFAV